jgi:hypothetical protein
MDTQLANKSKGNQEHKRSKLMRIVRGGSIGFLVGLFLSSFLIAAIKPLEEFITSGTDQNFYILSAVVMTNIICCTITGVLVALDKNC